MTISGRRNMSSDDSLITEGCLGETQSLPNQLPQSSIVEIISKFMASGETTNDRLESIQPSHDTGELLCDQCERTQSMPCIPGSVCACGKDSLNNDTHTLQLPPARQRCDSGNGSDIQHTHSSGHASPSGSDYGGSRNEFEEQYARQRADSLSRTLSKDSAISSADTDKNDYCVDVTSAPSVKVWPAEQHSEAKMMTRPPLLKEHSQSSEDCDLPGILGPTNESSVLINKLQNQLSLDTTTSEEDSPHSTSPAISPGRLTPNEGMSSERGPCSVNTSPLASRRPRLSRAAELRYGAPSRTASEEGTSTSPLIGRRLLTQRLSEKAIGLKVDVGRDKHSLSTAPANLSAFSTDMVTYPALSFESDDFFGSPNLTSSRHSIDSGLYTPTTPYLESIKQSRQWNTMKGIAPFLMEQYKTQKHWVQLAGHDGSFEMSDSGTILKKLCSNERDALGKLMVDPLKTFVPEFKGVLKKGDNQYIELQDLLQGFWSPCVMDCKIGTRTYLEDELEKAEKSPKPRSDMYEKMVKVDPNEPTEEEHKAKAVTKPRYMKWRENISSTSTQGFRIEGIKQCSDGTSSANFKTSRELSTLKQIFMDYTQQNTSILNQYLDRLKDLRKACMESTFFFKHELIGSSLLFIHDAMKANIWMIDFGKTVPLPKGKTITHLNTWDRGNHEDGYLVGLDNMINMFEAIVDDLRSPDVSVIPDGGVHI